MNKNLEILKPETIELVTSLLPIDEIKNLDEINDDNFDDLIDKIFEELVSNEATQSSLLEQDSDKCDKELLKKVSLAINDIVSQTWWNS